MTKNNKLIFSICSIVVTLILATGIFFGSASLLQIDFAAMSANSLASKDKNKDEKDDNDYEFVFKGTTEIAGKTYNITLYGNKDEEKSVLLKIAELSTAEISGSYIFVENKGYKIYFDDANESFVYTKYNPQTKQFSFNYTLTIGSNGANGKVAFTYTDEQFASEYDGEGLGNVPPTFTGYTTYVGAMFALGEPVQCLLTCYEDGTCVSISTNEVKFATARNGTWLYDNDSNVYTFNFEDEPFSANTETGSPYWKFTKTVGECSMEDAAENWTTREGTGICYWDNTTTTETPGNTFSTVYDEKTNTYYLLFEHGISAFGEFADRYVSWSPDNN